MTKSQLNAIIKSIQHLRQLYSNYSHKIFNLSDDIELGKYQQFEYEILKKAKLQKRIKRKLKRQRLLRQRYRKIIDKFRKKLKKKVASKRKVEKRLERARLLRMKKRKRRRKALIIKRLVNRRRQKRLNRTAGAGKIEMEICHQKQPRVEHPLEKKFKDRAGRRKASHILSKEGAECGHAGVLKIQAKGKTTFARNNVSKSSSVASSKSVKSKKSLSLKYIKKKVANMKNAMPIIIGNHASKTSSLVSSERRKSKKVHRLKTSQLKRRHKPFTLDTDNKYVPYEVLMGKNSPVTPAAQGKQEPIPIGDTRSSSRGGRFFNRRRKHNRQRSSSNLTSDPATTISTASVSNERNLKKKKVLLGRRRLQKEGGDSWTFKESQSLSSHRDLTSFPKIRTKKSTGNRGQGNLGKIKIKKKLEKAVNFERPIDKTTLRSILVTTGNKEYFKIPHHSISKPSYSRKSSSVIPRKPSIYNEKYFKNLVKTQTQSIRDLLTKQRNLQKATEEQELREEKRRQKQQREQEARKRRLTSLNNEKELERLLQAGLKSQFKLFDVVPGETPVITEDILKMSQKGEQINIGDLMPESKIFEWNQGWLSPPPALSKANISTTSKETKISRKSLKSHKNKKRSRRLTSKERQMLKMKKIPIEAVESDDSNDEFDVEVLVSKFSEAGDSFEEQQSLHEKINEVLAEVKTPAVKKKINKRQFKVKSSSEAREGEEEIIEVICSACGMSDCCKFKPAKCCEA